MSSPINYIQRVMDVTMNGMTYHVIKQTLGEYDADEWKKYHDTQEKTDKKCAISLNSRPNHLLRLTDRRTRGYKYLRKQRSEFTEQYEKEHPRPKSRLNGLVGIALEDIKKDDIGRAELIL